MTGRAALISRLKHGSKPVWRSALAGLLTGAVLWAVQPVPVSAQSEEVGSAILVLNQEALLQESAFGLRLQSEIEQARTALAEENQAIDAMLTAEELELTELRATMEPSDFRALADAFDARVTEIRSAQDAKTRDLQAQVGQAQQIFFEASVPVLLELVQDMDAAVLLDSRTVLLAAEGVDVTEMAIAAINEALGTGGEAPLISIPTNQ